MPRTVAATLASLVFSLGLTVAARDAAACGCLAPPSPATPVYQAGERILFAASGSDVTAYIQLQYSGDAHEFGWLLPLPSVPSLELGTDEIFDQLTARTKPDWALKRTIVKECGAPSGGGSLAGDGGNYSGASDGSVGGYYGPNPVVVQASIGPFDYAVLKADTRQPMLAWLAQNNYFVPAGTTNVVDAYIHPGAYFLALKLRPQDQSTSQLQPVVVHYASDLPMIPLVLTSVAATPHMAVQVWVLGPARAIPRNYHHVVLDDAALDWDGASDYAALVTRAVAEAPSRHAFVTEFAGPSTVMKGALDWPGRFGDATALAGIHDPVAYTQYLQQHSFPTTAALFAILAKYIPMPSALVQQGVTPSTYYWNLGYYLGTWRQQNPDAFQGLSFSYDPQALTDELEMRIVTPTVAASKLFDAGATLTSLRTALSPEDMTADPVFSFNSDLPNVSPLHAATLALSCDGNGGYDGVLSTEEGFTVPWRASVAPSWRTSLPGSLRIERLLDQGQAVVEVDNHDAIVAALAHPPGSSSSGGGGTGGGGAGAGGGCSLAQRGVPSSGAVVALLSLAVLALVRRRRRTS